MERRALSVDVDRRRLLMLGAATPLVAGCANPVVGRAPAAVDMLRVCNTDYYPAAARLLASAPGQILEVAFDYDPGHPERASAGLWLDGEKVGDAPRRSREWLGRMLNAGRRLRASVASIRPESDESGPACIARIEMTRDEADTPLGRAISEDVLEPRARAEQAHRYAALFTRDGAPPVYLGGGWVAAADRQPEAGDVWRVVIGAPTRWRAGSVECVTLGGEVMGRLCAEQHRMARNMLEAGLTLCAVVLKGVDGGAWVSVAIYLVD